MVLLAVCPICNTTDHGANHCNHAPDNSKPAGTGDVVMTPREALAAANVGSPIIQGPSGELFVLQTVAEKAVAFYADHHNAALLARADALAAEVERLAEKSDAEMLRVKACEHIAEGDEGWKMLRNICPSTAAVSGLRDAFTAMTARAQAAEEALAAALFRWATLDQDETLVEVWAGMSEYGKQFHGPRAKDLAALFQRPPPQESDKNG